MLKALESDLLISIITLIAAIIIFILIAKDLSNNYYPGQSLCDVGEASVVGDQKRFGIHNESLRTTHSCLVQDCVAYNKYVGKPMCMV